MGYGRVGMGMIRKNEVVIWVWYECREMVGEFIEDREGKGMKVGNK